MTTCTEPELPLQSWDGEGIPLMQAEQPVAEDKPSPIEQFAGTIAVMAQNRTLLEGIRPNDRIWHELLQDLAMLVDEGVTIGLRSPWARRVATPILFAHRALSGDGEHKTKALKALEILAQCGDERVKNLCTKWVKETFRV